MRYFSSEAIAIFLIGAGIGIIVGIIGFTIAIDCMALRGAGRMNQDNKKSAQVAACTDQRMKHEINYNHCITNRRGWK